MIYLRNVRSIVWLWGELSGLLAPSCTKRLFVSRAMKEDIFESQLLDAPAASPRCARLFFTSALLGEVEHVTAWTPNTLHAKDIVTWVQLAGNEAFRLDSGNLALAITAGALKMALISRKGDDMKLMTILTGMLLVLDFLKLDRLTSNYKALAEGSGLVNASSFHHRDIRFGSHKLIIFLHTLIGWSTAEVFLTIILVLLLVSIKYAFSQEHHAVTLAQVPLSDFPVLVVLIKLVDIQIARLALFELAAALIDQVLFKMISIPFFVGFAVRKDAMLH